MSEAGVGKRVVVETLKGNDEVWLATLEDGLPGEIRSGTAMNGNPLISLYLKLSSLGTPDQVREWEADFKHLLDEQGVVSRDARRKQTT